MNEYRLLAVIMAVSGCHSVRPPEPPGFDEGVIGIDAGGRDPKDGHPLLLQTTVYRLRGGGRRPLVIVNHGTPPDPSRRRGLGRSRFFSQAEWFLEHGFSVAIPMRRGYAGSDGEYAEDMGPCDEPDFARAGRETARDIAAAVEYFSRENFVDPARIVLVGVSGGGFGALAFAAQPAARAGAVINFSGGRGGRDPAGSGRRCSPARLVEVVALFGRTARLPTLWLYSENDSFFPPDLAKEMSAAWQKGGAKNEFVLLPPFGDEGHLLFSTDATIPMWETHVARFLRALGYSLSL
jgi:pimeloyl-ACP methyl ester carboxylesterase